jgi:hypothetical protein
MALVLGLLPVAAMAGETGTVYTQLGTNGLGIGYATSVSPNWAVRGQYNALPKQSFSGDVSDFGSGSSLTVDLDWNSVQLGGDWYPFGDGFRTTVGVVFNNSKIAVNGTGKINNKNATVNAEMKMSDSVAPYLGIGYGVKPKMDKGLGFNMDLGVMFQNPKGTLTATNTTATPSEIAQKQREFQEAADKLKYFPVLSFGISYSF